MNIYHSETLFYKLEYISLLGDSIAFMKQIWNLWICVQRHKLYLKRNLDAKVSWTEDWQLQRST